MALTETGSVIGGMESRDAVLRSMTVSDGSVSLMRKFVRMVPPVETALMEADEDVRNLEADFRCECGRALHSVMVEDESGEGQQKSRCIFLERVRMFWLSTACGWLLFYVQVPKRCGPCRDHGKGP